MQSLKRNYTHGLIHKTERDSHLENKFMVTRGQEWLVGEG